MDGHFHNTPNNTPPTGCQPRDDYEDEREKVTRFEFYELSETTEGQSSTHKMLYSFSLVEE